MAKSMKKKKPRQRVNTNRIVKKLKGLVKPNPRNRLKTPKDFVYTESFVVEEVVSQSYETYVDQTRTIGGDLDLKETGYRTELMIKVTPRSQGLPVRRLKFKGFSIVFAGDKIEAKIPRYEEKRDIFSPDACLPLEKRSRRTYVDREYREEEEAIEIAILSNSTYKPARRDRSVDYNKFM